MNWMNDDDRCRMPLIQNYWTPTWLCGRTPGQFVQISRLLGGCLRILHRVVFRLLLSWLKRHSKLAYFFLDICPGEISQKLAKYVTCTVPIVPLHKGLRQPDDDVLLFVLDRSCSKYVFVCQPWRYYLSTQEKWSPSTSISDAILGKVLDRL
jgi:hypothetical protein